METKLKRIPLYRGWGIKTDCWIYGSLWIIDEFNVKIIDQEKNFIEAYPNSIGEFTGYVDHFGNKIFENDILYNPKSKIKHYVRFLEGSWVLNYEESVYFPGPEDWKNYNIIGDELTNDSTLDSRKSTVQIKTMNLDKYKNYCLEQGWVDEYPKDHWYSPSRIPKDTAVIEIFDGGSYRNSSTIRVFRDEDQENFLSISANNDELPGERQFTFRPFQGDIIKCFVLDNCRKVRKWIIQSENGSSRCGAVAEFIERYLKEEDISCKFRDRHLVMPNKLMRRILNEYLYDKN